MQSHFLVSFLSFFLAFSVLSAILRVSPTFDTFIMDIVRLLVHLGCQESEGETYLALLKQSSGASVLALSKLLNLPRTTVYGHVDSLCEKNLIEKSEQRRGTTYFARPLKEIAMLYDQKIKDIQRAKKELIAAAYMEETPRTYTPKFSLSPSTDRTKDLIDDIFSHDVSEVLCFWPSPWRRDTLHGSSIARFHRERLERKISMRVLLPSEKNGLSDGFFMDNPSLPLAQIRRLPLGTGHTMRYIVYASKVLYLSCRGEHDGFIVDSKELAETTRSQFSFLWEQARLV
ncbi:MAG: hypothetical protein KC736_02870 [Candidatus Moranbacteria bacterium]|nr:hypothetical protein [Candidatus Moranbacteria bacterium]